MRKNHGSALPRGEEAGSANKVLVLSDEESVPALRTALEAALEGEPARVVKAVGCEALVEVP